MNGLPLARHSVSCESAFRKLQEKRLADAEVLPNCTRLIVHAKWIMGLILPVLLHIDNISTNKNNNIYKYILEFRR